MMQGMVTATSAESIQIKLNGYRIELAECEIALYQASGSDQVCVIPDIDFKTQKIVGLVGFITSSTVHSDSPKEETLRHIERNLEAMLPLYMIPSKLILIEALPLNIHGKVDYQALQEKLKISNEYA